jgi:hypothetical protein
MSSTSGPAGINSTLTSPDVNETRPNAGGSIPPPQRETLPGRSPTSLPPITTKPPAPAPAMVGIRIGLAMARTRLLRRPPLLSLALAASLVAMLALIERAAGSAGATDRTLAGAFRWMIPFVAFGLSFEAADRRNLVDAAWPAARYGATKRDVALGLALGGIGASSIAAVLLSVLGAMLSHTDAGRSVFIEIEQCAWIGLLVGAAHAAYFSFFSTFGRRGGGRTIPLALHVLFGTSTGFLGALLPNGNAQNLLGFAAPMHLPQSSSTAILVATTVVLALASALRGGD